MKTKNIYISKFEYDGNGGGFSYALGNGWAKISNAIGRYKGTAILNPEELTFVDIRNDLCERCKRRAALQKSQPAIIQLAAGRNEDTSPGAA